MKKKYVKYVNYEKSSKQGDKTLHPVEWIEVKGYKRLKYSCPSYTPSLSPSLSPQGLNAWGMENKPLILGY
jgi:hypothetical protein